MSYKIHGQEARRISAAIDLLEMASNSLQGELNNPVVTPLFPRGELLSLSRNIDTLERVCSELSAMLNRPPDEPTPLKEEDFEFH